MLYFYISLTTYYLFCIIKYREGLFYLKKDKYNSKIFINRIKKDYKNIFINPELFSLSIIIIALNLDVKTLGICSVVIYMALFLYKLKKSNKKLKIEKKLISRILLIITIYILLNIWFIIDYNSYHKTGLYIETTPLYYIILVMITYLSYFVIYISNIISKLFEKK